jgi:hypothetical protein
MSFLIAAVLALPDLPSLPKVQSSLQTPISLREFLTTIVHRVVVLIFYTVALANVFF